EQRNHKSPAPFAGNGSPPRCGQFLGEKRPSGTTTTPEGGRAVANGEGVRCPGLTFLSAPNIIWRRTLSNPCAKKFSWIAGQPSYLFPLARFAPLRHTNNERRNRQGAPHEQARQSQRTLDAGGRQAASLLPGRSGLPAERVVRPVDLPDA